MDKTLYKNICSKIQINGKLSDPIYLKRSVRQGCPISMLLYVIGIEVLNIAIKEDKNIQGISVPNINNPIKTFLHADDISNLISSELSYTNLISQYNNFSIASGSQINHAKTEILLIGNWKYKKELILPKEKIKHYVKVLGVYLGKNHKIINLKHLLQKIQHHIDIWNIRDLSFSQRICIVKTYLFNSIWHEFNIIDFGTYAFKKIETPIYNFLWNKVVRLNRNSLQHDKTKGGLNLPNLKSIQSTIFISRFKQLSSDPINPWQALYIYWYGLLIPHMTDIYRNNKLTKTLQIPNNLSRITICIKEFRSDKKIWDLNKKEEIYNHIRDKILSKHTIEKIKPFIQWTDIWKNWSKLKNLHEIYSIFYYLHDTWWTTEVANKRTIVKNLHKCYFCKRFVDGKSHMILKCSEFNNQRNQIKQTIIKMNGSFDKNNLLYLHNIHDKKTYNAIITYIMDIINKRNKIINLNLS